MGRGCDDVFRDLLGLQEEMFRLFDESATRVSGEQEAVSTHWAPAVDIYDTPESFVLVAEVPGLGQDDIQLEISRDTLVLRGERPLLPNKEGLSYHRIERPNGVFQRSFRFPADVDEDAASATYLEGVLRVTLPKRSKDQGCSVPVEVET